MLNLQKIWTANAISIQTPGHYHSLKCAQSAHTHGQIYKSNVIRPHHFVTVEIAVAVVNKSVLSSKSPTCYNFGYKHQNQNTPVISPNRKEYECATLHSAVSWARCFHPRTTQIHTAMHGTTMTWCYWFPRFIRMMKITLSLGLSLWLGSLINVLSTEKGTNHAYTHYALTHSHTQPNFVSSRYHYHHIIYGVEVRIVDVLIYFTRCHFKDSIRILCVSIETDWAVNGTYIIIKY